MPWNWELTSWPKFTCDIHHFGSIEKKVLLEVGSAAAYLKSVEEKEYDRFVIEILSLEGLKSAKIEGEILDRERLQSSIKKHFGLQTNVKKEAVRESGMAKLLCSVYRSFKEPLTHEMLIYWHDLLFNEATSLSDKGKYRTHAEPMQIVSNRYGSSRVFFEAPPSERVFSEMDAFITWFNSTDMSESILAKAAIAHVYFESIHPFEDGNGRIGRVLVEKVLSQGVGRPILVSVSKTLEKLRKEYYAELEKCNRTLEVQGWVDFFARTIILSLEESMKLLLFVIEKSKMLQALAGQINDRQMCVLVRMFEEGPDGFRGGLTAEKYIKIAKVSRATATRDLADLVEKGALVRSGELRYTRYWLHLKTANEQRFQI